MKIVPLTLLEFSVSQHFSLGGTHDSADCFGLFKEMAISVERHLDRAVSHPSLYPLWTDALLNPQ